MPCGKRRQIANRGSQSGAGKGARRRRNFVREKAGDVAAHAHDELASALLRCAECERIRHLWKIHGKGRESLGIGIDCCNAAKASPLHPERESAATAKEIDESERFARSLHSRTPSSNSETVTPSALASRQILSRLGLRTPR